MRKFLVCVLLALSAPSAAAQITDRIGATLARQPAMDQPRSPLIVSSSPTFSAPVFQGAQSVTPTMDIAGMKAWIVVGADGRKTLALTTPDGLTIVGEIYGPQGQNLSAALLGASPNTSQRSAAVSGGSSMPTGTPLASPGNGDIAPAPARGATPDPDAKLSTTRDQAGVSALSEPVAMAKARPRDRSATVLDKLKAETAEDLLKQAGSSAVWFPAAQAKPGAPVIYFLADPTCPHCARATEELAPMVKAGEIDLRVILAPILSKKAVYQSASLIQSDDPGRDFLAHELARFSSSESPLEVLAPADIHPDVARGLQRNVAWARVNGVKGVPFWIYGTTDGAKVAFGGIDPQMLKQAIPIPEVAPEVSPEVRPEAGQ